MNVPPDDDIARFDRRVRRFRVFARIGATAFIAVGLCLTPVTVIAGEPEAAIPVSTFAILGLGLLLMSTGKADIAETRSYFAVTQGRAWWNGMRILIHLLALTYTSFAVGVVTDPQVQMASSIAAQISFALYSAVAISSAVASILFDGNYFRRPALEVSARGLTVQYFRRRFHIPLADIGTIAPSPSRTGELHVCPAPGRRIQREIRGYFEPSTTDRSMPIYVLRHGVTATHLIQSLSQFSDSPTDPADARPHAE
ncbi:MAG: hypothetical protein QM662_10580 [Gordonia sp. (in: high G+C Gram-positive bacteria)]